MATSWFLRTGTADAADPNSYTKQASVPTCATGDNRICAIFATVGAGNLPSLTPAILSEMVQALDDRLDGPNVKLKA